MQKTAYIFVCKMKSPVLEEQMKSYVHGKHIVTEELQNCPAKEPYYRQNVLHGSHVDSTVETS